jgi:hypothetical protein
VWLGKSAEKANEEEGDNVALSREYRLPEETGADAVQYYAPQYLSETSDPQQDPGERGPVARPLGEGEELNPDTAPVQQAETPARLPGGESADRGLQVGTPVSGLLPFDLPALERGVEKFFAQMERLGEDPTGSRFALGLAPWCLSAAVTIVAFELARCCKAKRREGLDDTGRGLWPSSTGLGRSSAWG